jgi:hypothetical protein
MPGSRVQAIAASNLDNVRVTRTDGASFGQLACLRPS